MFDGDCLFDIFKSLQYCCRICWVATYLGNLEEVEKSCSGRGKPEKLG